MSAKTFLRPIHRRERPASSRRRCLFCFSEHPDSAGVVQEAFATLFSEFRPPGKVWASVQRKKKSQRAAMANISSSGLRRRGQLEMEVPGVNPWPSHFLRIPELRGRALFSRRGSCGLWGLRTILSAATLRRLLLAGTSLPVLIEADVIRGEVGQNCPPQFKEIHAAQILVENSTARIEQNGVRNRRFPCRIKRRL